jgi:hypothetical protein
MPRSSSKVLGLIRSWHSRVRLDSAVFPSRDEQQTAEQEVADGING